MEGLLGLEVELQLLACLRHLLEGRGADARVQRDPASLAPLLLRIQIVEPNYKTLVLLQLYLLNPGSTAKHVGAGRGIMISADRRRASKACGKRNQSSSP